MNAEDFKRNLIEIEMGTLHSGWIYELRGESEESKCIIQHLAISERKTTTHGFCSIRLLFKAHQCDGTYLRR